MKNIGTFIGLSLIFLTSGCSLNKMAVGTVSPMFFEASVDLQAEGNYEMFKIGVPANLKLMEGLLSLKPNDEEMLVNLIKGYSAYAFGVNETEFLKDKYAENDRTQLLDQALFNYSKSISYGEVLLQNHGLTLNDLFKSIAGKGIVSLLDDNFGDSLVEKEGIMFFAQALVGYINLRRDHMGLVSRAAIGKGMFDWVCLKDPSIHHGMCQIFYGAYASSRPKMLGGNPEQGKRIFEQAIKKYPHNWLIRIAYIENYIIPMSDEDLFAKEKRFFSSMSKKFTSSLKFDPSRKKKIDLGAKSLKLFQAMAIKRMQTATKFEKDLF